MEMRPHLGYSTSLGSLIGDLPAKEEELLLMLSVLMNTESRLFHVRPIYFSELLIETNFAFSFVPRPLTATMIAIEIPAAIRPYSMAVAPDSSFRKRTKRLITTNSCSGLGSSLATRNCGPVKSISQIPETCQRRVRLLGNHLATGLGSLSRLTENQSKDVVIELLPHHQNSLSGCEIAIRHSALGGSDEKDSDRCIAHCGKRVRC
jgi:hypothetical protein